MSADTRRSWMLTGATVACVTALYVPCVQRTVPGGDSGELITTACELGVAHPPGYPLFTLLARLAMFFLPSLSPAHSVNLMGGLLGAAACGALCITVCRLAGPGPGAVLTGGLFAVSRLSWQWSMVAEVFTLNNLFVGLLFFSIASFHCAQDARKRSKIAHWGALCCGLGLCNQHTLVLYILVVIPWVFHRLHSHQELSLRVVVSLGVCFLAGFLPYVYLPVSSYLNTARWSWGDQTTLSGLLAHLLRAEYGTFSLAKTESSVNITTMLQAQMDHCIADLSIPVLVLAGTGLLLSAWDRTCRSVSWLFAAMLMVYSLFFAWRANLDIRRPLLLGVVERFWLQSDAAVCVLAGLGLRQTLTELERRLGLGGVWKTTGWVLTVALLGQMLHNNHRECDQSRNSVVERFGRELLGSVPKDSIILTRGDLPGNSLRYLYYCQGVRPDVRLVDQEMMTYTWYVAKLGQHYPGVHFPGRWWDPVHPEEKDTFNLEQFLSHNTQRDVFACIGLPDGDPSWERSFARWPMGVCEYLVPNQRQFNPEDWAHRTSNVYNWSEPHNSFHPASWERVANEEMWQARMKTAFFLFDLAERMQGEGRARLFELSYTLYKEIVEAHSHYPPNWDKNLALACERLLRSGHRGYTPDSLLTCSTQHFSLYLEKEPTDPQASAIRSAITQLLRERDELGQSSEQIQ
ncbi:transmembrane protein 260 isoform X1 [Hippoglossus hippoglossus]|uniref:transmembrane protein 260 isoform X1 n=2 Tax=Hippoglossus hippoglossus TaxID=8267 RepID=UPI00148E78D7|nr:transmembrane protein 260 isoform X1 [Hippoglossus hippoglossus]XP_034432756.1 transmembrane protein 260 isoform X1 [Hippoglossus hippoglossus]